MSEPSAPIEPPDRASQQPATLGDSLASKVFVTILLLVVGGWVCATYAELLVGPRASPKPDSAEQTTLEQLLRTELGAGAWQLGNLNWEISLSKCSDKDFRDRWRAVPQPAAVPAATAESADVILIPLIRSLKPQIRKVAGFQVYEVDQERSRLQFWSRPSTTGERLVFARAAVNNQPGWQFFEVQATGQSLEKSGPPESSIWPDVPTGTIRICRRYDQEHRILAELWSFDIPLHELVLNWEKSGWRPARPLSNLIPSPDTANKTPLLNLTLENESRQILVRLVRSSPGEPSLAILTRVTELPQSQSP